MTSRTLRAFAAALVSAAALTGLAPAGAHAEVTIKDASGREVKVADTSRIVAIGGDVTEILYALKAEGKIAAVDSTSQFPLHALKDKPNVGYMRALSAEGVLSANPTVIVASKDAGPPDVVKSLKASTVPYVEVPDDHTPEGVTAKIRFIAELVGAESAGDALAKSVEQDFAARGVFRRRAHDASARRHRRPARPAHDRHAAACRRGGCRLRRRPDGPHRLHERRPRATGPDAVVLGQPRWRELAQGRGGALVMAVIGAPVFLHLVTKRGIGGME